MKINKNNFQIFGKEFEYTVVKSLIENEEFFNDVIGKLDPKIFTTVPLQKIVQEILDYHKNNEKIPSYKKLEWQIKENTKDQLEYDELRECFTNIKNSDDENVKDASKIATELIKRLECDRILTNAKKSINDNVGFTDEKLLRIVDQLQDVSSKYVNAKPFDMVSFLESDYNGVDDIKIPTGIEELDACMNGGLTKGTLGLLIAGSGFGKTTMTSILACNALGFGFKVLHIFFEDTQEEIACKYYAHLTGKYTTELSQKEVRREVSKQIFDLIPKEKWNNLKLVPMENGETTIEDIKKLVHRLEVLNDFVPDVIIIDYFSCLRTTSNETLRAQNSWEMENRTIRKIENFAKKSNIAIWVAEQTNRGGARANTATDKNANVQGSFQKTQPASAILYLDRVGCEQNYANLSLTKMRGGTLKEWDNIYLHNGTVQIDLSDVIGTDPVLALPESNLEITKTL